MNKEFKVDKLGFYRMRNDDIALVTRYGRTHRNMAHASGLIKPDGDRRTGLMNWDDEDGYIASDDLEPKSTSDFDLIEFIAPFDVWEEAKGLMK